MATKLFFRTLANDYGTGNNDVNLRGTATGWDNTRILSLTQGSAANSPGATTTVAGPIAGLEVGGSPAYNWYSAPLDADITISGSITWNIWASEAAMTANVAINGILEVVDGATGAFTEIDRTARTIEVATSAAVNNFSETPAAGIACKRGDRLRARIFADDSVDGPMAAASSFDVRFNGLAAADGDTWLQLTENLTFVSEPAGSQVFLTDTASAVSTASVDREAWTSRGGGVQTDVTNTVAGWTAPIQVTDTAGGTVVDWFTKPLVAFTLGGAVRCNIRALESNALANAGVRVEVARVAGDGTSPTVWAANTYPVELGTSEAAQSFLVSGDDLAITDGQRLRIRVYIDDYGQNAMGASQTVTTQYAGSAAATGDTYLTFTQTLTEYVAAAGNPPYRSPYPPLIAQ